MARPHSVDTCLAELEANPDDDRVRERAALALTRAGRDLEACALLEDLVNLTAHDGPTLPCVCRRCLDPAISSAEAEDVRFVRRFVVHRGRVLFYWAPEALADDRGLLEGIRRRLGRRLARALDRRSA